MTFLDNNVLNALVDGKCAFTIEDLIEAYHAERLEVVGSVELLEELLGTFQRRPTKFKKLWKLRRKVIGRRVLAPLGERHRLELQAGGKLPISERYVRPAALKRLDSLPSQRATVAEINSLVRQRKQTTLRRDQALKNEVLNEISKKGKRIKDFDRHMPVELVTESVEHVVTVGSDYGFDPIDPKDISFERLPSVWLLCAATAARAMRITGDNRKPKASDDHDRLHASAGAYFDVLVTDDGEFINTLSLIPDLPFEVRSTTEFSSWLSTA